LLDQRLELLRQLGGVVSDLNLTHLVLVDELAELLEVASVKSLFGSGDALLRHLQELVVVRRGDGRRQLLFKLDSFIVNIDELGRDISSRLVGVLRMVLLL
jgi:hypothetical protein